MNLSEYQDKAKETVAYDNDDIALDCTISGLMGELGELMEVWKKYRRGDDEKQGMDVKDAFDKFQQNTAMEAGDLLWYLAIYLDLWNIDMEKVLEYNIEKLRRRKELGTLHASKETRGG